MQKFNGKTVKLLESSRLKELRELPKLVAGWRMLRSKMPKTHECFVYTKEYFLGGKTAREINTRFWEEMQSRTEFMMATSAIKMDQLLDGIVQAINERNTTVLFILVRQMMEHVSVNFHFSRGVTKSWSSIRDELVKSIDNDIVGSKELEDLLIGYAFCSLFNWDAYEKKDFNRLVEKWTLDRKEQQKEGKFVNVLNCIDELSDGMKDTEVDWRKMYDLVCDFVHPNRGTNEVLLFPKSNVDSSRYVMNLLVRNGITGEAEESLWLRRLEIFGAVMLFKSIDLQYGLTTRLREVKFLPE